MKNPETLTCTISSGIVPTVLEALRLGLRYAEQINDIYPCGGQVYRDIEAMKAAIDLLPAGITVEEKPPTCSITLVPGDYGLDLTCPKCHSRFISPVPTTKPLKFDNHCPCGELWKIKTTIRLTPT